MSIEHDAFEVIEGAVDAPVFLTCEHASERFPAPYALASGDARLVGTHWAFDPGAEEITRELAAALGATAVLARFSRLIVDANRELESETLLRDVADGLPIALNTRVSKADREQRIARFHVPFHDAIDRELGRSASPLVFPVHTFTDSYEGSPRAMEIGVLFDEEEALAEELRAALDAAGFVVAMNEPWSGRDGLIYSAERHARNHGRRALELEVRQDKATDPAFRSRLVPVVARFFREVGSALREGGRRA